MNILRTFKLLVLVSLMATITSATLHWTAANYVTDDWKTLLEWDGDGGLIEETPDEFPSSWPARILFIVGVLAAVGLVLFTLVFQIGLLFFWRFARAGFLVMTALWLALTPFLGLSVTLPLEDMLYYLATLCDGAVLAMAYVSPVRDQFYRVHAIPSQIGNG